MSSPEVGAIGFLAAASIATRDARATPPALRLPGGPAAALLVTSVMCAGPQAFSQGWRPSPEGGAFHLAPGRGAVLLEAADQVEAEALLAGLSALTLDALLVAFDGLCRGRHWVAVDAADVLAAKGYRRWGEERSAFERKVLADLGVLSRLSWRAGGAAQPLFGLSPQPAGGGYLISAGPALRRHLRPAQGHALGRAVLSLDHRHNRGSDALAKKLAVALALREPLAPVRSRDLLASVGEFGAARDRRQARIVDRLRAAAARLRELDLYELELGPVLARTKGWAARWLQAHVVARPLMGLGGPE